ncbi:MAG: metallophosphoesterase [Kiritimatiellales bacterium]
MSIHHISRRNFLGNTVAASALMCAGKLDAFSFALEAARNDWTLIVLPDIQYYTDVYDPVSSGYTEVFNSQARWIVANKDALNIKYVIQLGDITNHNHEDEWQNAQAGFSILDGHIPYAIVSGNHDYSGGGRSTLMNTYFPYAKYSAWPTFGGAMVSGEMENTYHIFEAAGKKWLLLALEWGPRNETVEWADTVLSEHSDCNTIMFTHAYLYYDSTRYDWTSKGEAQQWNPHSYSAVKADANDGEELWQKLLKKHPQVQMAINGHVMGSGLGFLQSAGDAGNMVHQMLVNYQRGTRPMPRTGFAAGNGTIYDDGSLRILRFLADGKTVQVRDYSPYRDYFAVGLGSQFSFQLSGLV